MVFRSIAILASVMICSPSATAQRTTTHESKPQQAIIYRDGYALLEEKLDLGDSGGAAIRLPAQTDLASVRVMAGSTRVSSLELKEITEEKHKEVKRKVTGTGGQQRVEREMQKTKQRVGYLLRLNRAGSVVLQYGTTGVVWTPHLDVVMQSNRDAAVSLTAVIVNNALDLRQCRVRLASGAGKMTTKFYYTSAYGSRHRSAHATSRSADVVYDIGRQDLLKKRTTLVTFRSGTSRYSKKYIWNTDTRERVQAVVLTSNPFKVAICPTAATLYDRTAVVSQDSAEWTPPKQPIVLTAGNAPGIDVERSVTTTEVLSKKRRARPFNHAITFQISNKAYDTIQLDVIMPKKFGSRHKTIYNFKRQPDRRPGQIYIWELTLKRGQTEKIAFDFDSEHARFGTYRSYEKAEYAL